VNNEGVIIDDKDGAVGRELGNQLQNDLNSTLHLFPGAAQSQLQRRGCYLKLCPALHVTDSN